MTAGERVDQLAVLSTVLPRASRDGTDRYRWALAASAVIVLAATGLGFVPVAIVAAAFLIPVTYLVYLYDVNAWEETPARVVVALFVVTGALAALVSLVFFRWVFADAFVQFSSAGGLAPGISTVPVVPLLIFAVALPIVAEIAKNLPAIVLARMPQFDDMIDGLTFGVAAGTAYAALETIVAFWPVVTSGSLQTGGGLSTWFAVVANLMVVKSLIYGTATGIAVAAYSGKGAGNAGVTGTYLRNLALAAGANILYWLGVRLLAYAPSGQFLGLLWGVVILGLLIVRARRMLQAALLEAALESATRDSAAASGQADSQVSCPECASPLFAGADFCAMCGTSVRSTRRDVRRRLDGEDVPAASARPRVMALVVAAVLVFGTVGAVISTMAHGDESPPKSPAPRIEPGGGPAAHPRGHGGAAGKPGAGLATELVATDQTVVIGDVTFPVPAGWAIGWKAEWAFQLWQDQLQASVYATLRSSEARDAFALVQDSIDVMYQGWTGMTFDEPQPIEVSGRIVSGAYYAWQGTAVDQQSSWPIAGIGVIAIRDDGEVLYESVIVDPNNSQQGYDAALPIVNAGLASLAGDNPGQPRGRRTP